MKKILYLNKKYNKYISCSIKKDILISLNFLISIMKLYIYLYFYSKKNYNFLFFSSDTKYLSLFKNNIYYENIYYFISKIKLGFFSNWFLYKKNLILLKWLILLFTSDLKHLKNKIYKQYLYSIYIKLNIKYKNLKELIKLPKIICFITPNKDHLFIKELNKLNKILVFLNFNAKYNNYVNIFQVMLKDNYNNKKYINNILLTSILHGRIN